MEPLAIFCTSGNNPHPSQSCMHRHLLRPPPRPPRRAEQISTRNAHRPILPIGLFHWATSAMASQILWGPTGAVGALAVIPVDAASFSGEANWSLTTMRFLCNAAWISDMGSGLRPAGVLLLSMSLPVLRILCDAFIDRLDSSSSSLPRIFSFDSPVCFEEEN